MIRIVRGALALVLLGGAGLRGPTAAHAEDRSQAAWALAAQAVKTALEVDDPELALRSILELEQLRPADPLPTYLRARVAESAGNWSEAYLRYQQILSLPEKDRSPEWTRLASGRWVRVRRLVNESHVRAVASQTAAPPPRPGLVLVMPLEPMVLGAAEPPEDLDLEALGVAAASWIVATLAQVSGVEPVNVPTALRLRRVLAGQQTVAPARSPDPAQLAVERSAPPVTTTLGVTYRLSTLIPTAAPPWMPEGSPVPARYLAGEPTGTWTGATAQALAHFQQEHDLAPTGALDAQTRATLELAFRRQLQTTILPAPHQAWSDPAQAIGKRIGAVAVLTGTLEFQPPDQIRWNLAWVSPADGALVSEPLGGLLPEAHFETAWDRLVRLSVSAVPVAVEGVALENLNPPPGPRRVGARDYGRAILLIEEQHPADAAVLFRRAAREGGGERARWFAMAWSISPEELDRQEERLIAWAIYGRPQLSADFLRTTGLQLAPGFFRGPAPPAPAPAPTRQGPLPYVPDIAWIRVTGRIEGR